MCDLCKSYICDYLHLKEPILDPKLALRQKKVRNFSHELAYEIERYLRQMHPFTRDHFQRILKDAAREGKRQFRHHETETGHRLSAERVIVKAYLDECKDLKMDTDLNYWSIVLQEAGLSRSDEAVKHWLGTKIVNLLLVLHEVHECHSQKILKEFGLPVGLRAHLPRVESKEEDDDLYT